MYTGDLSHTLPYQPHVVTARLPRIKFPGKTVEDERGVTPESPTSERREAHEGLERSPYVLYLDSAKRFRERLKRVACEAPVVAIVAALGVIVVEKWYVEETAAARRKHAM